MNVSANCDRTHKISVSLKVITIFFLSLECEVQRRLADDVEFCLSFRCAVYRVQAENVQNLEGNLSTLTTLPHSVSEKQSRHWGKRKSSAHIRIFVPYKKIDAV